MNPNRDQSNGDSGTEFKPESYEVTQPKSASTPAVEVDSATSTPEPEVAPATTISPTPSTQPSPEVAAALKDMPASTPQPTVTTPLSSPASASNNETAQPVVATGGQADSPSIMLPPKPGPGKKKLALLVGIPTLLLALAVGGVFGLYLPNTPSNVWSTGVNRTGKGLEGIVTSATDSKKLQTYKTSEVTGTAVVHINGATYSGNLNSKFDDKNSTSDISASLKDKSGAAQKLTAKVLTQLPSGSNYPDIYFKVSGLQALGLSELVPSIGSIENKWVVVSSDYLKSLADMAGTGDASKQKQPSSSDIAELAQTVTAVTRQYVFSTAKDKAVFEKRSFVGKEKINDLNTYHYKVGINAAHAEAYCNAVSSAVLDTKAYKKLSGDDAAAIAKQKKSNAEDCADLKKSIKPSDSYDVWIEGKYKLLYKFRVYDKSDKSKYVEAGQVYKGGDNFRLFVETHESKAIGNFSIEPNLKTNVTKATVTYTSTDKSDPGDVRVTLTAKPGTGSVKITKPTDATPVSQLFGDLSGASTGYPVATKAADSERETDIMALQVSLEASFAKNNYYPTFAQLNNAAWRKANMASVDAAAYKDPDGNSDQLVAVSDGKHYGYTSSGCTAAGCSSFTLTTKLSTGVTVTKQSF